MSRVLRDEGEEGRSHLEDGPRLPPATVRRLCCDASLVAILERADGTAIDVGRKTRAIPPAMRRALAARDTAAASRAVRTAASWTPITSITG